MSDIETNLAITLREIAANSPKVLGKILNKINKAAKSGKDSIIVSVSDHDYDTLDRHIMSENGWNQYKGTKLTPLIEKLFSYGFTLSCCSRSSFWTQSKQIEISW